MAHRILFFPFTTPHPPPALLSRLALKAFLCAFVRRSCLQVLLEASPVPRLHSRKVLLEACQQSPLFGYVSWLYLSLSKSPPLEAPPRTRGLPFLSALFLRSVFSSLPTAHTRIFRSYLLALAHTLGLLIYHLLSR